MNDMINNGIKKVYTNRNNNDQFSCMEGVAFIIS